MQDKNIHIAKPLLRGNPDSVADKATSAQYISSITKKIMPAEQTRSSQTVAAYKNCMRKTILPRVREEFFDDSPSALYEWLASKVETYRPATFRQYRAAIIFYLESMVTADFAALADIEQTISELKKLKPANKNKNLPHRTSSSKRRFIRHEELVTMVATLRLTNKWGNIAADYLLAAIATGLRPSEWDKVEIIKINTPTDGIVIQVKNGKNTNFRSTGEFRWMLIPPPMDEHVTKYIETIKRLKENGMDIREINKGIGRIFTRISKRLFGNKVHITPYTARHQFSANAKNVYSQPEVAMLHGHRSTATATKHYGRRLSGFEPFRMYYAQNVESLEKFLSNDIMNE